MPQKRTGAVRRRQPRNKKTLSAVISAVLVLAAVLVYYFPELETYLTGAPNTDSSAPAQPTQSTDAADCAVYFLDVGQGDSILIQIGTDYNMLIDAGTREAGETIESDPGFTGKVKSQIMHWNAMLQDFLMIRFGQIISRLTENTDPMFWVRRS